MAVACARGSAEAARSRARRAPLRPARAASAPPRTRRRAQLRRARLAACVGDGYESSGPGASRAGVPALPTTPQDVVQSTARAVRRALDAGVSRVRVRWLLPSGARRANYMSTNSTGEATAAEEFRIARLMGAALLDALDGSAAGEVVSERLDDDGTEPSALLRRAEARPGAVAAVVTPYGDTLEKVVAIEKARAARGEPLLVINPEWSERADAFGVSDFGFGAARRRAEEFVESFAPCFELYEVRVGNPRTGIFKTPGSGVVRVMRAYPDGWAVYALLDGGSRYAPLGVVEQRPTYKQLEKMLLNTSRRRNMQFPQPSGAARLANEGRGGGAPVQRGQLGGGVPLGKGMGEWAEEPDASDANDEYGSSTPPLFTVTEIDAMYKRMLQKALMLYGVPTAGKVEDLRTRLKFTQARRMLESATTDSGKSGRRRGKGLAPTECRVCDNTGRRVCPSCGLEPTAVNLSCALCGGWGYVLCPACEGGRRAPFPTATARDDDAAVDESDAAAVAATAAYADLSLEALRPSELAAVSDETKEHDVLADQRAGELAASDNISFAGESSPPPPRDPPKDTNPLNRFSRARVTRARASVEGRKRGQLEWACVATGLSEADAEALSDEALLDWMMQRKARELLSACERQGLPQGTSTKGKLIARLCNAAPKSATAGKEASRLLRLSDSPGQPVTASGSNSSASDDR